MLKLKENIDFKKLEEYGFEYWSGWKCYVYYINTRKITIYEDRKISFNGFNEKTQDTLFSMITDGLIEKVEKPKRKSAKKQLEERVEELEKEIKKLKGGENE